MPFSLFLALFANLYSLVCHHAGTFQPWQCWPRKDRLMDKMSQIIRTYTPGLLLYILWMDVPGDLATGPRPLQMSHKTTISQACD